MTDAEMDRLMHKVLIDVIALDMENADSPEVSFQPSRRYSEQIRLMLKNPLRWAKNRKRRPWQMAGRLVAVILLFISLSFGLVMLFSAPARAAFERWIVEWWQTHIVYRYYGESEGTLPRYEFAGLPEGFTELRRTEMYNLTNAIYGDGNGKLISFTYAVMTQGGATEIVPNGDDVYNVVVGKNQGILFIPQDPESMKTLIWNNEKDGIHFTLVADLPESDLIDLAESLRKKKKK